MRRLGACLVSLALAACGGSTTDDGPGVGAPDAAPNVVADGEPADASDASADADAAVDASDASADADAAVDASDATDASDASDAGADAPDGDGGGPVAAPECTSEADCQLVNDCCNCLAIPAGATPPACNAQDCLVATCTPLGISHPSCVGGRCILAVDCDESHAACDSIPPSCPPGQVASVRGACWGNCVDAKQCASVSDCSACGAADLCVSYVAWTTDRHCVAPPPACGGDSSCGCVGPSVCGGSFGLCSSAPPPGDRQLACSCPTC